MKILVLVFVVAAMVLSLGSFAAADTVGRVWLEGPSYVPVGQQFVVTAYLSTTQPVNAVQLAISGSLFGYVEATGSHSHADSVFPLCNYPSLPRYCACGVPGEGFVGERGKIAEFYFTSSKPFGTVIWIDNFEARGGPNGGLMNIAVAPATYYVTSVPEPSSLAMLAFGGVGLIAIVKRKRR